MTARLTARKRRSVQPERTGKTATSREELEAADDQTGVVPPEIGRTPTKPG